MAKKRHLILLVDDDKDMCDSLADVLSLDTDYNIKTSTDPVKALDMVMNTDFELIIIDYKMPKMNGLDLLKCIKERKPDSKIFILTAFISNELIEQAKKELRNSGKLIDIVGEEKIFNDNLWMTVNHILNEIENELRKYIELAEDEREYTLISLWIIGTYLQPIWISYPYIGISGAKRTGKSKLLKFIEMLAFNALFSTNILHVTDCPSKTMDGSNDNSRETGTATSS